MDEADRDMDMAADPFLEAGIDIPKELPYQKKPKLTPKLRMKINSRRNSAAEVRPIKYPNFIAILYSYSSYNRYHFWADLVIDGHA